MHEKLILIYQNLAAFEKHGPWFGKQTQIYYNAKYYSSIMSKNQHLSMPHVNFVGCDKICRDLYRMLEVMGYIIGVNSL